MEQRLSLFDYKTILKDALFKFLPKEQLRNPVMAVVFIGAVVCTIATILRFSSFNIQITLWLWFTCLFGNLAEAVAEGRGKNQAASLKKSPKIIVSTKNMRRAVNNSLASIFALLN